MTQSHQPQGPASPATPPRISYFLQPNRYPGRCAFCGEHVDATGSNLTVAKGGFVQKDRDSDTWQTVCLDCAYKYGRFVPDYTAGSLTYCPGLAGGKWVVGVCTKCNAPLGLVKSSKSGKWYLAEIRSMHNPRVAEWAAHRCPENNTAGEAQSAATTPDRPGVGSVLDGDQGCAPPVPNTELPSKATVTTSEDQYGNLRVAIEHNGQPYGSATVYQYGPQTFTADAQGFGWTENYRTQPAARDAVVDMMLAPVRRAQPDLEVLQK